MPLASATSDEPSSGTGPIGATMAAQMRTYMVTTKKRRECSISALVSAPAARAKSDERRRRFSTSCWQTRAFSSPRRPRRKILLLVGKRQGAAMATLLVWTHLRLLHRQYWHRSCRLPHMCPCHHQNPEGIPETMMLKKKKKISL